MPTQMPAAPSWTTGQVLTSTALTNGFANLTNYANAYMGWLAAAQEWTAANTFSGGVTVNTTGVTIAPQTAITFSHASARIVPGATGLYFRNNANGADNVAITDAGVVTIRAGLTVTAGGATVTAGGLTVTAGGATITAGGLTVSAGTTAVQALTATSLSGLTTISADSFVGAAASSKILTGSSNILFRDSTDATTLASMTNGGVFTVGSAFQVGTNISCQAGGAVGTSATTNLFAFPIMNGTPTGNMGGGSGGHAVIDYSAFKLWVNFGGTTWKSVTLA